jgi:hypothetical protein
MAHQDMIRAMRHRISRRAYIGRPITNDQKKLLEDFIGSNQSTPFKSRMGCVILDLPEISIRELRKFGTYGMIRGARTYLVGFTKDSDKNLEDFGFFFERLILYATSLNLGTCWLGGTFNRSVFHRKAELSDTDIVPAVSPVGAVLESKSIRERVIRFGAGSYKRKPWRELFFHGNPELLLNPDKCGAYETVLEMVRIAPSASNKQPWRIVKDSARAVFHFFLQRSASYQKILSLMKQPDIQRIDMGIALCHFELAAAELGLQGHWEVVPASARPASDGAEYLVSWVAE